jgi:MraZ protein
VIDFQGTYEHTLDAKNRLTIPVDQREELKRSGVVLAKGIEGCVTLWDPPGFREYCDEAFKGIPRLSADWRDLQRYFKGNSFAADLDTAGRVLVPQPLLEHAEIAKEVTIVGAGECMEIWNRAAWSAKTAQLVTSVRDITEILGRRE